MYAIYKTDTGQGTRIISCPPDMIEHQLSTGESYIEGQFEFPQEPWYVDGGQFKTAGKQPSSAYTFNWVTKQWEASIDKLKDAKWEEIKKARDAAQYGGFTWDGSRFDSDQVSQQRIAGSVQLANIVGSSFSVDWILADNTTRTLSASDMVAVGAALGAFVQAQFVKGQSLRNQIMAATTPEEISAISW